MAADQRRNDAELIAGDHHRHEIEHRAAQDADIVAQKQRQPTVVTATQQRARIGDAAQFALQRIVEPSGFDPHAKALVRPRGAVRRDRVYPTMGARQPSHRFRAPRLCAAAYKFSGNSVVIRNLCASAGQAA